MTAVGVALSALFVWLALRGIELSALGSEFAGADLVTWLPPALAIYTIGYVLRGVRCQLLVRAHGPIRLTTATGVVLVGYAANNILPARLGELVRASMLAERAKMPVSQALGVTFIERVLDGLAMLLLLVVATLTVDVPPWMTELVYVAAAVFGAASLAIAAAVVWPGLIVAVAGRCGGLLGPRWRERLEKIATHATGAAVCLRDPKQAVLLLASSVAIWCFEASIFVFLLPVFGAPLSIQIGLITMCVTGFGLLLPSSPGFIGPFHYFASQVVMLFGVSQATGLAYASLVHLTFFLPTTIAGGCVMLWYGMGRLATPGRAGMVSRRP
jgi:uncharacterized protein (TIRG00374 family)